MSYGETDSPASSTEVETTAAKSHIALLKGLKNVMLLSGGDIATMQDDIATIKADLAAIRAILES